MKNIIDPSIKGDPELWARVRRANELLAVEVGRSSDLVDASWNDIRDERDRPLVRLKISDWTGSVHTDFLPDDLKHEGYMQSRLMRLWGDLLQSRSHSQVESLGPAATEVEGA